MNPMSLLTLPGSTLLEAQNHSHEARSGAERGERRLAMVVFALVVGATLLTCVWSVA